MHRSCTYLHERRRSHALHGIVSLYAQMFRVISIVLCCLTVANASAMPDSTKMVAHHPDEIVLAITNLSFDCYQDTLVGWADDELHYLPHSIHWGVAPESSDPACASQTPKHKRLRVTDIHYPNWKRITGSFALERMNGDDTLADIVLYLWGHVESNVQRRDSVRRIVIFSQNGLDAVRELNIATMNIDARRRFQAEPYFAIELEKETDLTHPAARSLSGMISYEVKKSWLDMRPRQQPERSPTAGATTPIAVHVYPNPAATSAQVEAEEVPPGDYNVALVAVNGTVVLRQDVTVEGSRSLFSALDVSRLASGYYLLRLYRDDHQIETYPIIITR